MLWLSENTEELVAIARGASQQPAMIDVAIVGSGYGGAVAALRFAQAGRRVFVLERGQEYVAGEFPNDLSQAGGHVRVEAAAQTGVSVMGNEDALFDFRIGLGAGALVGNGLGGGSLINAAVGLAPDAGVFRQSAWPAAFGREDMAPWFARARETLEVRTPAAARPSGPADGATFDIRKTAKYLRMQDLAAVAAGKRSTADRGRSVTARFEDAPLAIQIDGTARTDLGPRANCTGCGDCVTGCNADAKLSLTKTYLPAAFKAGARMFTGVSVLTVQHAPEGNAEFPWVLRWVRTGDRRLQHQRAAAAARDNPAASPSAQACTSSDEGWIFQLRARTVILAAGTFGSTEILLRSRAQGLGLSSTALGVRVTGNGDDISAAGNLASETHAVGQGSGPPMAVAPGPTISAIIRFEDADDPGRNTLVEDGAAPGLTRALLHELLTTLGTVAQLDRFALDHRDGADPLTLKPQVLQRSLLLLGIGHDSASGRILFDTASDRAHWEWTGPGAEPVAGWHASRLTGIRQLGGVQIRNPAAGIFPGSVGSLLSGPQPGGALFTVHPLGGCRMGDGPHVGVVNDVGAVYQADGQVYAGLYVMDGSVIPTSLGVNPLLTITALSERACARILAADQATPATAPQRELGSPVRVPPYRCTAGAGAGATLYEVLRGPVELHDGIACIGRGPARAALYLRLPVPDWQALFDDPRHSIGVGCVDGAADELVSRLDIQGPDQATCSLRVTSGSVTLFRPMADAGLARANRFVRLLATHAIGRWIPDGSKGGTPAAAPGHGAMAHLCRQIAMATKGLLHATEVRLFEYRLQLQAPDGVRYELRACKRIEGAASWSALRCWLSAKWRHGGWPRVERASVWQQLGELPVTLYRVDAALLRADSPALSGTLALDLIEVMRRMLPQFGPTQDFVSTLFASAGYPLLLLRYLLKARLLDFRAPDYQPGLPAADPATMARSDDVFELLRPGNLFPPIPLHAGRVSPEMPVRLDVRRSLGVAAHEKIRIGLIRYRQPQLHWAPATNGVVRARSIVLLNGFAQSTRAFVAPELGSGCLASMLFDAGWDVWLLEYRVSPLLDASAQYATMDDIAAIDIPRAVDHIVQTLASEGFTDPDRVQIAAYSHCVGSASLAMSILGGHLKLPYQPVADARGPGQEISRLSAVSFSQFLPFVVGSDTAQRRLQLASFLQNVLGRDMVEFTAGTVQPDLVHALLDRVFASLVYPHEEQCPHERLDLRRLQPDSTTCKRMAGLLSRLFSHRQLLDATHEKLDWYFGRTNLGVFMHGVQCVEYERLVNAEGQNAYTTDARLRQCMTMPLLLQHGLDNVLFDKESLGRSRNQLLRAFGLRAASGRVAIQPLPGYAHFDCTIGRNAPTEVFPRVVGFFNDNHRAPAAPPNGIQACTRARLPRTGPIVGWVRPTKPGTVMVRIWIELDTTSADQAVAAMTDVRYQRAGTSVRTVQAWTTCERQLAVGDVVDQGATPSGAPPREARIIHAVADIALPDDAQAVCIRMVGVHRFIVPAHTGAAPEIPAEYPAQWGRPMVLGEVGSGWDPLGLPASVAKVASDPDPDDVVLAKHGALPAAGPADRSMGPAAWAEPSDDATAAEGPPVAHAEGQTAWSDVQYLFDLPTPVADSLLTTLAASLAHRCAIAQRADPGTLSRLMRAERGIDECAVQLDVARLQAGHGHWQFLAAGCRHPGITGFESRRADRSLRDLVAAGATRAHCMFMLGDQIYADARAGLLDTASVIERLLPRYRTAFGSAGFRGVASRLPLFMVPDDHEIEEAWSRDHLEAGAPAQLLLDNASALFDSFQRAHGPDRDPQAQSCNSYVLERPGCACLVLDTRFNRRTRPAPSLLLEPTWCWLTQALIGLQRDFGDRPKFIVSGSVFAPGVQAAQGRFPTGGADSWQQFHADRVRMLQLLMQHDIRNAVFLSSDYHCSAVAHLTAGDDAGFSAWAIVAPPLHAPMRFANTQPHALLAHERLTVPGHADVHIALKAGWSGEGWLQCDLQPAPDASGWDLQLRLDLRDLDSGSRSQVRYPPQGPLRLARRAGS